MDLGSLSRNAHLLAAPPGDRAHIAVRQLVGGDDVPASLIDFRDCIRDLEVQDTSAFYQTLGMLGELEDFSFISPLAFEHRAGIM